MSALKISASFVLALFFIACSSVPRPTELTDKNQTRDNAVRFTFEKSWARQTTATPYYGYRINHIARPIVFEDLVIQGNEIDGVTAYNKKSGHRIWHRELSGGVTADIGLKNGILFIGAGDGFFYALDAKTGVSRWTFPIRSEGIGAPLVTDDAVYFLTGTNSAYALNLETGTQIWFYNRQDSNSLTVRGASQPSEYHGRIYFGFSDGFLVALDKTKGTMIWEKQLSTGQRFRDVDAKPVIDNGRVYVSNYDGQLFCVNADNGQTVWTHDEGGFLPVTISGDTLYYSTSTRKIQALDKNSGKIIWSQDLLNTVATQPILYRGLLVFGEWAGRLRALDARTGDPVTAFITGRGVTSSITVDPALDRLYVMTIDANLFSLRLRHKMPVERWPWDI